MTNIVDSQIHRSAAFPGMVAGWLGVMLAGLLVLGCQPASQSNVNPAACNCQPTDVFFPYRQVAEFGNLDFQEPSGAIYHPALESLFVVGDQGVLTQVSPNGALMRQERLINGGSFEGVTLDPNSGLLYIAYEGFDKIVEVDPATFSVTREIELNRAFEGRELIKPGGSGLEGIAFVPGNEGGTFYLANQGDSLQGDDPAILIEAVLTPEGTAQITRAISLGVTDLAEVWYNPATDQLWVVSDRNNLLLHVERASGEIVRAMALPGEDQEALALDTDGFLYLGEDSGTVSKYQPLN